VFELTDRYSLLFIGHMAQMGKKNLNLFQTLHKEKAAKAKAAGSTEVPNLQEPLVEVHVHGGSKRKVELPAKAGRGKSTCLSYRRLLFVATLKSACLRL